MTQAECYSILDSSFDFEGNWTGPNNWEGHTYLGDDFNYYVTHYKRDISVAEYEVFLQPAGSPPVSPRTRVTRPGL